MPSQFDSAEFTVVNNRKRYYVFWNDGAFCGCGQPNTEGLLTEELLVEDPTVENAEEYVRAALAATEKP